MTLRDLAVVLVGVHVEQLGSESLFTKGGSFVFCGRALVLVAFEPVEDEAEASLLLPAERGGVRGRRVGRLGLCRLLALGNGAKVSGLERFQVIQFSSKFGNYKETPSIRFLNFI